MTTTGRHPSALALTAATLLGLLLPAAATPRFVLQVCDHDGSAMMPGDAAAPFEDWINVTGFGNSATHPHGSLQAEMRSIAS